MSILIKGTNIEDLQRAMLMFRGHKIVELLDHGDLIDRDVLKEIQQAHADLFKGSTDYGEKCRRDEALNAVANIVNAPTIIEAEAAE